MRIVGGMFGLEENLCYCRSDPPFMREPRQLFISARCAIQQLIQSLQPPQVWMPSYLCCSMLDAVDKNITKLEFFPIKSNLTVASLDWVDLLMPGSLVVLIDYFGFPCDKQLVQEIQSRGAFVLEDASQALLSTHVGLYSDFVVYSPRKIVGVPDGGILQYRRGHWLPTIQLLPPPNEWWLKALEACISRREFDKFGGERKWYELFRGIEAEYPLGPFRMSELSEVMLLNAFDYQKIAQARRANFLLLANKLTEFALFKKLDDQTIPLGYPITLSNRDVVLQTLFTQQIYPPVHWIIGECVPNNFVDSHNLSRHIMTIPCDQRLGENEVLQIAETILETVEMTK